ncbi:MAG: hypothetical protein PHQ25_01010 [Acidobacteriota bacterium]|nr:hypothetical protein [Acidobacteriota bacterium]
MNIGLACYHQAYLPFRQQAVKSRLWRLNIFSLIFGQIIVTGRSNKAVIHFRRPSFKGLKKIDDIIFEFE